MKRHELEQHNGCAETRNWRTSQTVADIPPMAAEPSSSWPLEVGQCPRQAKSSRHTHESVAQVATFASGQNVVGQKWLEVFFCEPG